MGYSIDFIALDIEQGVRLFGEAEQTVPKGAFS